MDATSVLETMYDVSVLIKGHMWKYYEKWVIGIVMKEALKFCVLTLLRQIDQLGSLELVCLHLYGF